MLNETCHPRTDSWLNLKLEISASSYREGARGSLDVERVVGLSLCWQRDIIVHGFAVDRSGVETLKFVQIDGMFFLHLGLDPLLQVADRLVVGNIHSKRELLLTSPNWRLLEID